MGAPQWGKRCCPRLDFPVPAGPTLTEERASSNCLTEDTWALRSRSLSIQLRHIYKYFPRSTTNSAGDGIPLSVFSLQKACPTSRDLHLEELAADPASPGAQAAKPHRGAVRGLQTLSGAEVLSSMCLPCTSQLETLSLLRSRYMYNPVRPVERAAVWSWLQARSSAEPSPKIDCY